MPSIKTTSTTSSYDKMFQQDQLPLGQRPEGDDQFENAFVKLEDAFHKLMIVLIYYKKI